MVVLYILLFILCLSVLIAVHEAGHLAAAKIFKVYCFEYAIGFGPKIFSKKRKNGETYFSIRAIPFGGFVSMYGEDDTIPEGVEIDPSRSLLAIKKWKRAIIMAAGVTMNFVLALVIFFVYEAAFPTYTPRYGHVTVSKNNPYITEVHSKDLVYASIYQDSDNSYIFYEDNALLTYDSGTVDAYFGYNYGTLTLKDVSVRNHALAFEKQNLGHINMVGYSEVSFSDAYNKDYSSDEVEMEGLTAYIGAIKSRNPAKLGDFYILDLTLIEAYASKSKQYLYATLSLTNDQYEAFKKVPLNGEIKLVGDFSQDTKGKKWMKVEEFETSFPNLSKKNLFTNKYEELGLPNKLDFSMYKQDETTPVGRGVKTSVMSIPLTKNSSNSRLPTNFGLSMQLDEYRNNFGEAVKYTFTDFADASSAIVRGLGQLITTKDGWRQIGGIIQIGVVSTQILEQNGFGRFLMLWGLISVNLGIVNLLPFPGLDGWHLLVLFIEGVFRKEIPPKVKNIVSAVGIALLFLLMALVLVKDVIGLF